MRANFPLITRAPEASNRVFIASRSQPRGATGPRESPELEEASLRSTRRRRPGFFLLFLGCRFPWARVPGQLCSPRAPASCVDRASSVGGAVIGGRKRSVSAHCASPRAGPTAAAAGERSWRRLEFSHDRAPLWVSTGSAAQLSRGKGGRRGPLTSCLCGHVDVLFVTFVLSEAARR